MDRIDLIEQAQSELRLLQCEELEKAGLIPKDGLYYPTIYYPPIPMYPPSDPALLFDRFDYDPSHPAAVYIHIPFCRSRCLYCHWVVNVGSPEEEIDGYLALLAREMTLWREKFGIRKISPRSVLIGGGTPTALSPKQTDSFCRQLAANLDFGECAQITCETEPGSILGRSGLDKLRILKETGVSRISLGVQAFDDELLAKMGRRHTASDVRQALEQVRKIGFASLSIDLIYGFPGCTAESWLTTLETALALEVDAFQLYRLRIVPHGDRVGTVKGLFDAAPDSFPGVDDLYLMKKLGALVAARAGRKETSCRLFTRGAAHDSQYMKDHADRLRDTIGFGPSSWTNLQGRFYLNTGESLASYAAPIRAGELPINRGKIRTPDDAQRWAVTLPLKHGGVAKKKFEELTGVSVNAAFPRQIGSLKRFGLLRETDEYLRLTDRGRFFADEVVMQFYHPDYLPFPPSCYAEGELNPFRSSPPI